VNAVEIEEAISALAEKPFDSAEFPFEFLQAFGHNETTIKKLKKGATNKSDLGGVLNNHSNNIHIVVCEEGKVAETIDRIKSSPATSKAKTKFALATDGLMLEAEDLLSEERVVCEYENFPDHFGFFLSLAGISTVKAIRDNSFDVKATSRLNRLYVQLLSDNPDWATGERREDMNHFMARLIFCFFAEDTSIFAGSDLFTDTIEQMSDRNATNTHEVISEVFRAMDTKIANRNESAIKRWALDFPYVNGGLFAGDTECPKFSRIARSYLLNVGKLDWTKINPDIFGSMIQAVADDEERAELGMHYTSVPNILKVLNPLFLDDLRDALEDAGDNARKLLNLRKRISKIRVFDPACGSGNFLVIAYKELRQIENELNERRDEKGRKTEIPLTNFRGIEIRGFSAEIARLALIIAEYQCDVAYLGQQEALIEFLPLSEENWITCGNALRLDWLSVCPPTGSGVKHIAEDLFEETHQQFEVDFANEGGETFICGNPPYRGSKWQSPEQKADLLNAWQIQPSLARNTDYVSGWLAKFLSYQRSEATAVAAFVTTNSICQGQQASEIWPIIFGRQVELKFAKLPFKWSNLASNKAGVTVIVIGLAKASKCQKQLFYDEHVRKCSAISPYLIPDSTAVVTKAERPLSERAKMLFGNMPRDGGYLFLSKEEADELLDDPESKDFVKAFLGSEELINGKMRFCLWIEDDGVGSALKSPFIASRLKSVEETRLTSKAKSTRDFAARPHRFVQIAGKAIDNAIVVPRVSSENRDFLPVDYLSAKYVIGDRNFAMYDAPLWNMALIASRLHWVWIGTVCVRMRTDFSYSNTLGWNTFPVPTLTDKNKEDLTRCAENILLARELHFPATIADLYDPEKMPDNLRQAHEENDEVLERIYIGRRFRNDTERLEKLFDMYTKMTQNNAA
jgi:hypothetical protein